MLPPALIDALAALVGPERVRLDAPLATYTTFRVGGPAECLVEARDSGEVERCLAAARQAGVPVSLLGGGSNTVVSDRGVRGLVIRAHGGQVREEAGGWGAEAPGATGAAERAAVRADAGVTINALVRWTIARGLVGLEAWAGTPGTVGGAIFGNAHYGGRNIGDLVLSVRCVAPGAAESIELPREELAFAYDRSRFQATGEAVLSAVFALTRGGDPARLRETAHASLAHRKRTQPLSAPSAGCVFQNPDPARDHLPAGMPWSAGALVDRAGLKGHAIGGARVSSTHANFIVSDGTATASDIRALVRFCQQEVRRLHGVELREEIRWMGEFEGNRMCQRS